MVSQRFPPIPESPSDPFDLVRFGDTAAARVVRYDDAIMARLREQPGIRFTPIERVLAQRRREIERANRAEAEAIYARLAHYYLDGAGERGAAEARALREIIEAKPH